MRAGIPGALSALLLLACGGAWAQYGGPAVDTCHAYAARELKQSNPGSKLVFDRDASLVLERYTKKAGSQFVSSILTGNGAIVLGRGAPVELSFLCLLANDRTAVFFDWRPRPGAPVLAQCKRAADAKECLDVLVLTAEQDLTQLYAQHLVAAREIDVKAGNENAANAFRRGTEIWRQYRDAECGRRGAQDSEPYRACVVELTRRRAQDLR